MKRKKIYSVLALTMAAAMALTGCGAGNDASQEAESTVAAEENTTAEDSETTSEEVESEAASEAEAEAGVLEDEEEIEKVSLVTVGTKTIDTYYYADPVYIDVQASVPVLSASDAEKYPKLQQLFDEKEDTFAERSADSLDTLMEFGQDDVANRGSDEILQYEESTTAKVLRADSNYISVLYVTYANYGGAHPNSYYSADVYSPQTQKRLELKDVVKDTDEFLDIVKERVETEYEELLDGFYDLEESFRTAKEDPETYIIWTLENDGITVYFSAYELGPYVLGSQVVTVYFEDAPELFAENVTQRPDNYVYPFALYEEVTLDIDEDGKKETIYVEGENAYEDEEWGSYHWRVHAGNRELVIEAYEYDAENYIIRANDQYYLYVVGSGEDDMTIIHIVDLKRWFYDEDSAIYGFLGSYESSFENLSDSTSRYVTTEFPISDPNAFTIAERIYLFSTYSGRKTYSIDENGFPTTQDEAFTVRSGIVLRTKQDIDSVHVNGGADGTDEVIIPKNTYLSIVATDGKSYVDVVTVPKENVRDESYTSDYHYYQLKNSIEPKEDTEILRIFVDEQDAYPLTVNGIEEDDLFDGMLYAG